MTGYPERPNQGEPIPLWSAATPFLRENDDANIPTLTPFFSSDDKVTAAVLVLPGGGYGMRADHEGRPIAEWLNSLGISAFVVDYRVAPYRHPVPLTDASRAMRMVRFFAERWGIDGERLGILGFSAGGHLAATLSTHFDDGLTESRDPIDATSSRPNLAVLCYPVISFGTYTHSGSQLNLLGEDPSDELVRALSLELQVSPDTPPSFLWHTADDEGVSVANSLLYAEALGRNHVPFDLHVYQHGRHGLGLATDSPHVKSWTMECAEWLSIQGFA